MDKDTLKQLMEAKGITIKELSEAIGAAPITINMWLMGEHKPGEKYLPKLANLLQMLTTDYMNCQDTLMQKDLRR